METRDLTSLLRPADTGHRTRTSECPDEHWVAAYVDGTLEPAKCEEFERHLADCDSCMSLVGFLSRDRQADVPEPVPETTVARARLLFKPASRRWTRYVPQVAAAAMVLISIPILLQLAQPTLDGRSPQGATVARTTRAVAPDISAPQVLFPTAGATVAPGRLTVRWTAVPGSDYYDVRILDETGGVVVEQRVTGTEWMPSDQQSLRTGVVYFVQVDAYPSEGKSLGSKHVPFRAGD
jgi:hypothetical protein